MIGYVCCLNPESEWNAFRGGAAGEEETGWASLLSSFIRIAVLS
jgi:hypothetical protein